MSGARSKVAKKQRLLGRACGGHRAGSAWLQPAQETSLPGKQDGRLPSEPGCMGAGGEGPRIVPAFPLPLPAVLTPVPPVPTAGKLPPRGCVL